jgi:hypothetical protein
MIFLLNIKPKLAKSVVEGKSKESLDAVCDKFCTEVACCCEGVIEYL